jgi:hypothetical protein
MRVHNTAFCAKNLNIIKYIFSLHAELEITLDLKTHGMLIFDNFYAFNADVNVISSVGPATGRLGSPKT